MLTENPGIRVGNMLQRWADLKRFYSYLSSFKRWAVLAGLAMGVSILLALPVPLLTMHLIDKVLPQGDTRLLYLISGIIFLILIVRTASSLGQQFWFSRLKILVLANLRSAALRHLQDLPLRFFQKTPPTYLASRIVTDCEQATQGLLADSMLTFVRQILTFVFGLAILLTLHAKLTLAICLVLPLFVFSVVRSNKLIRDNTAHMLEAQAQSTSTLQQTLSGISVVKAFAGEKRELIKNARALKHARKSGRRAELIAASTSLISDFVGASAPVLLLCYGGLEVIAGRLTIGELVAFSSYLGFLFGPIEGIVTLNIIAQGSLAALRRVFELMDTPGQGGWGSLKKLPLRGLLELQQVTFAYESGLEILSNVNLRIRPGEVVVLAGPSGAGKTTLLYSMAGLLEPQSGSVQLDGRALRDYDRRFLRQRIGLVPQEHVLFPGTIADNIRYGCPKASAADVENAARLANAHEFIDKLDRRYDTRIGEGGTGLSVGQKQRLCIARALLMKPSVLLLDEPTASVDARSERLIQQTMASLGPEVTCVLVSHRQNVNRIADRVIVVNHGTFFEQPPTVRPRCAKTSVGVWRGPARDRPAPGSGAGDHA